MPTIADVRAKFPQYNDMSDDQLASALHKKFYADIPEEEFRARIGLSNYVQPAPPPGVIIHGQTDSYVSDQPDVKVTRDASSVADPEAERRNAVQMEALKMRGQTGGMGAAGRMMMPVFGGVSANYGDEAVSALKAFTDKARGGNFGNSYDVSQEIQRQEMDRQRAEHPYLSVAGDIAGAATLAPILPTWTGGPGASLGGKIARGAATALGYGALYGAGNGSGFKERAVSALEGGAIGVPLGALAPLAGAAVGKAAEGAKTLAELAKRRFGNPSIPELAPYSLSAAKRVSADVANDLASPVPRPPMMPETMVADLGSNTGIRAGVVARQPGEAVGIMENALETRKLGAPGRIKAATEQTLGPQVNAPAMLNSIEKHYGAQSKPLYDAYRSTPVPYTQELDNIVSQLKNEPSVLLNARRLANLDDNSGQQQFFAKIANDGSVTIERNPNAAEWDYIKRGLDKMWRSAKNNSDGTGEYIYGNLAKKITSTVDKVLSPNDPKASIWAKARASSAEGFQLRDAFESGQEAFKKSLSPDQMRVDMGQMSQAEKLAYMAGAKSQVQDIMGNASTSFTASGDVAARRALGSEYAKEKVGIIAGKQKADALINRLDAEGGFEKTRNAVSNNSITAKMQAAMKEHGNNGFNANANELGKKSLSGLALEGAYRGLNFLSGGALAARSNTINRDIATMLTQAGNERDKIVTALAKFAQNNAITKAQAARIENFVRALIDVQKVPLIDATQQ